MDNIPEILTVVGAVFTLLSFIVKLTPTPKDDEYLKRAMDFLSFLKPKDAEGQIKLPFTSTETKK